MHSLRKFVLIVGASLLLLVLAVAGPVSAKVVNPHIGDVTYYNGHPTRYLLTDWDYNPDNRDMVKYVALTVEYAGTDGEAVHMDKADILIFNGHPGYFQLKNWKYDSENPTGVTCITLQVKYLGDNYDPMEYNELELFV